MRVIARQRVLVSAWLLVSVLVWAVLWTPVTAWVWMQVLTAVAMPSVFPVFAESDLAPPPASLILSVFDSKPDCHPVAE